MMMLSPADRMLRFLFVAFCVLVFVFLVAPVLTILPLSFNGGSYLLYPLDGVSLRWYRDFLTSDRWLPAVLNSLFVGGIATVLATALGTAAALGIDAMGGRWGRVLQGFFILPVVVPVVVIGSALYALFAPLGLTNGYTGVILAHTMLASPFVVITVTATLRGFDRGLLRAAASLGAHPFTAFRRVTLPLVLPGVVSGAAFAFATSLDEIVATLFLAGPMQRTLPLQMFDGMREQISPTITAAATLLFVTTLALVLVVEALRRRTERLRGKAG